METCETNTSLLVMIVLECSQLMHSSDCIGSKSNSEWKSHLLIVLVIVCHLQIAQAKGPFHLLVSTLH